MRKSAAVLGAAFALGLGACGGGAVITTPEVVDDARLAELLRPRGEERLVLANFWATWCGDCMAEMPELVELYHDWAARGVRVLAVSIDLARPQQVRTAEQLGAFLRRRDLDLPVVAYAGDFDALTDRRDLPGGPPSTLVFDRAGREVGRIEGAAGKAELEALLHEVLGQ